MRWWPLVWRNSYETVLVRLNEQAERSREEMEEKHDELTAAAADIAKLQAEIESLKNRLSEQAEADSPPRLTKSKVLRIAARERENLKSKHR